MKQDENHTAVFVAADVNDTETYSYLAEFKEPREAYMFMARNILLDNRNFLEKATAALIEKETLLYSDVQKLRMENKLSKIPKLVEEELAAV